MQDAAYTNNERRFTSLPPELANDPEVIAATTELVALGMLAPTTTSGVYELLPDTLPNGDTAPWTSPGRMYDAIKANAGIDEADAFMSQIDSWLQQRKRHDAARAAVRKTRAARKSARSARRRGRKS